MTAQAEKFKNNRAQEHCVYPYSLVELPHKRFWCYELIFSLYTCNYTADLLIAYRTLGFVLSVAQKIDAFLFYTLYAVQDIVAVFSLNKDDITFFQRFVRGFHIHEIPIAAQKGSHTAACDDSGDGFALFCNFAQGIKIAFGIYVFHNLHLYIVKDTADELNVTLGKMA